MSDASIMLDSDTYTALNAELVTLRQRVADLEANLIESKQTEFALKNSEARFRRLTDNIPGMVYQFRIDPDGTTAFTHVSPGCRELHEIEPEQVLRDGGQCLFEMIHPDDRPIIDASIAQSTQTQQPWKQEYRITTPSGQQKWLQGFSNPVLQSNGSLLWDGCAIEITDRKTAEAKLHEQQQLLRTILDAAPVWVWMTDLNGKIQLINRTFCEDVSISADRFLAASHYREVLGEEAAVRCISTDQACLAQDAPLLCEEDLLFVDGRIHSIEITKAQVRDAEGKVLGIVGVGVDATDRKTTEAELQQQEQFLRSIFDGVDQIIFVVDVVAAGEFRYHSRNLAGQQRLNQTNEEVAGKTPLELFGTIGGAEVQAKFERCVALGTSITDEECLTFNGEEFWFLTTFNPVRDSTGRIYRIVGTATDTTKLKHAEISLRQSEERLQLALAGSGDGFWDWDMVAGETYFSSRWFTMLGYAEGELPTSYETWESLLHPDDKPLALQSVQSHIANGLPYAIEFRMRTKSGDWKWIGGYGKVVAHNAEGRALRMAGTHKDISDRKRAEQQLRDSEMQIREKATQLEQALLKLQRTQAQLVQTEKMSSLGQLVAGVAHEINNPVNFIYGNLSHAQEYTQDLLRLLELYQQHYPTPHPDVQAEAEAIDLEFLSDDLPKLMNSMKVGTDRIRAIVLALRNFSRMDEADLKPVDLHEGIDSTLMILQNRLKETPDQAEIEIVKQYANLPLVECYAGQLNQVFMNILGNAIDAMESAGRRDKTNPEAPKLTISTEVGDRQVRIRIADNGLGMKPEVQQRIFEPFFTTKPVGKGTGLGLSISYQVVVEKHGGNLQCLSELGQGTEFVIDLPIQMLVSEMGIGSGTER